jgi:hypothetical protein
MEVLKVLKKSNLYDYAIDILSNKYDWKNRGKEYWKKRYNKNQLDFIGYILKIDNKYVGFVGFVGNKDTIGLSVWYVDKSYRKFSLSFITKVMLFEKNRQIVNSSPNPVALKVFIQLFKFKMKHEFIGLPKKLFTFSTPSLNKVYFGEKLNVCYDKKVSIIHLIYLSLRYNKLCLGLYRDSSSLIVKKKINVLFKNMDYIFPTSIKGDIYE